MRLQFQVGIECIVIACTAEETVHEVACRTILKLRKLRPSLVKGVGEYSEVRRTIGNSLLDPDDKVGDVLNVGDFVLLVINKDDSEDAKETRRLEDIEATRKTLETLDKSKKHISFDFDPSPQCSSSVKPTRLLVLDGESLLPRDLVRCEKGECIIQLSMESEERVRKSRALLEKIAAEHKTVYGITTGFGTFSNVCIEPHQLKNLQLNLIRSHAAGYGTPLSPSKTRMLLALRINILAKGYSGISVANIKKMIAAFNAFCVSYVPQQGTVGCSGDLAPLAHLALGLLGEGKMWSPSTGWDDAAEVLKKNHLEPLELGPKEGLALINGTQMVTSIGALTLERAHNIARQADIIAALSLEVLKGTTRAFDIDIHRIRPHKGQMLSALRLRSLLHSEANPSQIAESHRNCNKVQDAYTMRCVPQVHGIVHDTIEFVRGVLTTEMNSATDNPLVFADREEIISGGNFHGEYPAKVLDYLAIGVHELAQMSERRLERLVNHELSGLPTFLTPDGGLNSGFMIVQCCAASLVSENKVLCHPSSVDSIPTSCNQEDHVSMGGFAARKALTVVEHVEAVLAMELLAACQGMEFLKPLVSTAPLNKVYQLVRSVSEPINEDRVMQPEIDAVVELLRENKIYTDWANRHLAKTNHRPISDLSNELRDYRIVANIVFSIVPDPEQCTLFKNKLNAVASNIEGLNACLNFLQSIGVNCTKVTAAGIDTGQLSSVLQLLFSLSTFKQQEKHRRKEERTEKQTVMPPSTTTKLPSLHSPQSLASTASPSKLQTPSRLAHPKSSLLQPSTPQKTSALRPPTTGLRPPSRGSGNNNGSVISSGRSSVASSATYTSIPSVASATTTTSRAIPKPVTTPKKSQLQAPKSSQSTLLKPPSSASPARQPETATQSKMMKLKLFGGKDKEKKDKTPQPSPAQTRKTVVPASVPKMTASKITLGNSRPTEAKTTKLAPPSKKQPVQLRVKQPSLVPPSTARPTKEEKRTSKSSEEDSAYAGFGSTSPSSSTQSSISLRSASSKGSREAVCETKMETPTQPAVSQRRGSETQDKPTLAVKAIRVAPSRISKPAEKKKNSGELLSTPSPSEEKVPVQSPTVGIVSPMMHRKQVEASPELRVECEPSSSKTEEKKKPPVPSRGNSRLETTFDAEVTSSQVPSMPPVRQPPSYTQLLTEGKINKKGSHFDSSTSEDSLDSITTTVRTPAARGSGCASAGNTIDRSARGNSQDSSGYISESGLAIYEKMQARLRECRDSVRKAHFDYGDSFEDSSSLSSGISENFDDISTDDLSGPDHPMAAATYGKPSDYQPFTRSSNGRGPRSSSSSMDSRARRVAEQENLHQLLQQCRTSQRGAACGSLRSPGYGTSGGYGPHLTLSADGDTLSVHSRGSLRASSNRKDQTVPSLGGYHSLDRKSHLSEMYGDDGRLSIWDQRNTMALVSPRRVPQQQDSHRHSVTGSLSARGGSRSESIYAAYKDPMQLQRLADEPQHSPSHSVPDPMGSQLSLASSTAYASLNDKYESELRKMNRELDGYRHTVSKLTRRHDDYAQLMEVFDQRLAYLGRHVEKAQLRPDELAKLRTEIEHLRDMSSRVAQTADARKTLDGAGELLRQPSLESVASMASHRSSMSSSSKSSKTDKTSLSSFGKTKKSWIRSSFSKAFSKKKGKGGGSDTEGSPMHLNTISGSTNRLDEVEVVELKKQLEDRDVTLTDVRLDALDRAREVDVLRETVNRLKHENKQLKQDMTRILARSRASSQTSLAMNDDEPVYEVPPSSSQGSYSSKRSSGCDSVKVTVNVDLRGTISTAICPDNEIIIGFLPTPVKDSTWEELDQQIYALFDSYIGRIDPDRLLGLHCSESVIGYQMGDVVRQKGAESPKTTPTDVISPTTTVRMFLRGACQQSVDSLVLECLFPRSMLEQLLRFLLSHRRLVLSGATGIGKSNLARQLASYLSVRIGLAQDAVQDIQIPDDTTDKGIVKVEKQLEGLLRGSAQGVVLMDNIPRHRIAFVSSVFSSVQLALDDGPFVICTVNRACQLPEMQVHHNFKMFLLTNRMDGVKGFMGRFLRRRIIEAEFRLSRPTAPELLRVIQFLPTVLQAVNTFIEKANSLDVTVGPRIFLQCPLGIEESREWFVRLWNENVVPYMVRVAREGVKVLGRCGTFEDPTDTVCEHWPWVNGPSGEELLSRLSIKDIGGGQVTKQPFNPLDTLIRLQASRNAAIENI